MTEFIDSIKDNETAAAETDGNDTVAEEARASVDEEAGGGDEASTAETPADKDVAADAAAEQTATADVGETAETEPTMAEAMAEQYDEATRTLSRGELVEGRVVDIVDGEVHVDVGYKSEGRIPSNELGLQDGQAP